MLDFNTARLITLTIYPILEGFKDANTFSVNSKKYHTYGFITRAIVCLVLTPNVYLIPLVASYFWIVFDLTWNIEAKKPLLYVGKTAFIDKKLGGKIYFVKAGFLVASIVLIIYKIHNLK